MTPSPHPSAEAHELEHGGELGELGVQGSTYVRLPRGVRWVHGVDLQAAGELLPAPGVVHTKYPLTVLYPSPCFAASKPRLARVLVGGFLIAAQFLTGLMRHSSPGL